MGLLNSIMPGVAAVAPFLWTAYADATRRGERIFLWATWLAAAAALLLPNAQRFVAAAAAVFCLAVFRTPLIPFANSMTFGVLYLAAVQSVEGLVPDGLRTTAQGVFASVTFGLGGLVGSLLGGLLYEPLGMRALYLASALVSAAATLLYVMGSRCEQDAGQPLAPEAAQGGGR